MFIYDLNSINQLPTWYIIFYQDVTVARQLLQYFLSLLFFHVDTYTLLIPVNTQKVATFSVGAAILS